MKIQIRFYFENTVYILTNGKSKDERHSNFASLIESCGAHVTFLDADIHDMIVAEVSHLPQLIATSLVNTISEYKDFNILSFAAGGFRPSSAWQGPGQEGSPRTSPYKLN